MMNLSLFTGTLYFLLASGFMFRVQDFSGKLKLEIGGDETTYAAMTKSGSRFSFQDKGIAIYILNSEGEGTIAEITMLSPDLYSSNTHIFEIGTKSESGSMLDIYNNTASKRNEILNFKFRRIDQMEDETYVTLKSGTVDLTYGQDGELSLSFEGEDHSGLQISGTLELSNPYLIDRRD